MKFVTILMFAISMQAAAIGYSQSTITLTAKNATLKDIFNTIEKQAGYRFLYHENEELNSIRVELAIRDMPVREVLQKVLDNTGFEYKVARNKLVIVKAKDRPDDLIYVPVKGVVLDAEGVPMPGVTVSVKGKATGTVTNEKGQFSIDAALGETLVFSRVGKITVERVINNPNDISVVLESLENDLQEVVVVGYGTKKREEITGSISTVKGTDLTVAPVGNVTNTLAGRLSGLISVQASGQPSADQAALNIRGFGARLVVVDGVIADFSTLDPNTIESVSVLKDASASIYGARAGNGVILVTTKRGNSTRPVINFNTSRTWQSITIMPKPVTGGQFAEMAREGHIQGGNPESTAPIYGRRNTKIL
ncbi:MAG: TonB-dependent receptor plug domain-containing protein [Niabella sp.]